MERKGESEGGEETSEGLDWLSGRERNPPIRCFTCGRPLKIRKLSVALGVSHNPSELLRGYDVCCRRTILPRIQKKKALTS